MDDLDINSTLSDRVNSLIDVTLQRKSTQAPQWEYLGAARLGVSYCRALQYKHMQTPRNNPLSGKLLRTFEMGHVLEGMAIAWLRNAGFEIATRKPDGSQLTFLLQGACIQEHGIIYNILPDIGMAFPPFRNASQ